MIYDISIPKEDAIKDFNLLTQDGIVGFYNICEIIQIFGFESKINKAFNIFTIATFEKSNRNININEENITKGSLQSFRGNKGIKWGIKKKIININDSKEFFERLINQNIFKLENECQIEELSFLKKQYIPPNHGSRFDNQISKVLKNNFDEGSYIIEGFDLTKENVKFILDNPELLKEFSEKVSEYISISIGSLSDRLGNVIFQFPIRIFKSSIKNIKPDKGFNIKLYYDDEMEEIPTLDIVAFNKLDGVITDFKVEKIKEEAEVIISTRNEVEYKIIEPKNNLILSSRISETIKEIIMDTHIPSIRKRTFALNNKMCEIDTVILEKGNDRNKLIKKYKDMNKSIPQNLKRNEEDWIRNRKYDDELKELEKNKKFIQYYGKDGDDEKALDDIRFLIKRYGKQGVYLWDPYLSADDIKKTLYYTPYINVPLKAISELESTKKCSKEERKKDIKKEFEMDDIDDLQMDFEFRAKFGDNGFKFHDRFIIFPLERPRVWSLGISVNQLGKSHHIMQEVKNAQHILNAFNELWEKLDCEECKVWKTTKNS